MTLQLVGLIIAGYSIVKMIETIGKKDAETYVKVFAVINLVATLFFALMIFGTGTIK